MLHPSYTELMEKINLEDNEGEEPVINSRYSIVIAASKRARELIDSKDSRVENMTGEKPLSVAVRELFDGDLKIIGEDQETPVNKEVDLDGPFEELGENDPAFSGGYNG